jgi:hypothetical protein
LVEYLGKTPNSHAGVTPGAFKGTALLQRHRKENEASGLQSAEVLDAISAQEPMNPLLRWHAAPDLKEDI